MLRALSTLNPLKIILIKQKTVRKRVLSVKQLL